MAVWGAEWVSWAFMADASVKSAVLAMDPFRGRNSNRWKPSGAESGIQVDLAGGGLDRSQALKVGPREELRPRTGKTIGIAAGISSMAHIAEEKDLFSFLKT